MHGIESWTGINGEREEKVRVRERGGEGEWERVRRENNIDGRMEKRDEEIRV